MISDVAFLMRVESGEDGRAEEAVVAGVHHQEPV